MPFSSFNPEVKTTTTTTTTMDLFEIMPGRDNSEL